VPLSVLSVKNKSKFYLSHLIVLCKIIFRKPEAKKFVIGFCNRFAQNLGTQKLFFA